VRPAVVETTVNFGPVSSELCVLLPPSQPWNPERDLKTLYECSANDDTHYTLSCTLQILRRCHGCPLALKRYSRDSSSQGLVSIRWEQDIRDARMEFFQTYVFSWFHLLPGEEHLSRRDNLFSYCSPPAVLTKWEAQFHGTAEGILELPYSHKRVCQTNYSEDNEKIQATHEILSRDQAMMQWLKYWDPKDTLGLKFDLELRLNGFWQRSIHLERQPAELLVLSQDWNGDTSWWRHQIRLLCHTFWTAEIVYGSHKMEDYSRSLFSIWANRPDYRPVTNTVEGKMSMTDQVFSWYSYEMKS